jgi:hypothetical protein
MVLESVTSEDSQPLALAWRARVDRTETDDPVIDFSMVQPRARIHGVFSRADFLDNGLEGDDPEDYVRACQRRQPEDRHQYEDEDPDDDGPFDGGGSGAALLPMAA